MGQVGVTKPRVKLSRLGGAGAALRTARGLT